MEQKVEKNIKPPKEKMLRFEMARRMANMIPNTQCCTTCYLDKVNYEDKPGRNVTI